MEQSTEKKHHCQFTQNRNKAPVDPFYQIVMKSEKYSDRDFTPDATSMDWVDMKEDELVKYHNTKWQRAQDIFPGKSLFGGGITPDDINQGGLGDCWFLAAISGIAEKPGRMETAFLNKENYLNEAGIYAFNFYSLGVPHTVVIDDYLPVRQLSNGHYKTLFAEIGDDNSLWGAMIEKAFAKYWGNYGHIVSGSSNIAMKTLIGSPFKTIKTDEKTVDWLWDWIHKYANTDHMLTAGSRGTSDDDKNEHGLVDNHAYTLLKSVQLSTGERLVQLRNPWGRDSFHGDWSDKSGKWNDSLAKEAGLKVDQEDGLIFMSIEDFKKMYDVLWGNVDPSYYHRTHFLRLNDDGKGAEVNEKG